jgi:hypothetical protein
MILFCYIIHSHTHHDMDMLHMHVGRMLRVRRERMMEREIENMALENAFLRASGSRRGYDDDEDDVIL